MSEGPCALEIELLRDMNGEKTTIAGWGSWMTPAIEYLHSVKLVDRKRDANGIRYVISDTGKAYLASLPTPPVAGSGAEG